MARGDHIYALRFGGIYAHHGIDAGDGTVIHYTSDHWVTPRQVRRTSMDLFARGDEIHVRDYEQFFETLKSGDILDRTTRGLNRLMDNLRGLKAGELDFSEDAVMRRAESRLGEFAFDLVFNNCEHFATWCKTGISNSDQIIDLWRQALTGSGFMKYRVGETLTNFVELPWKLFR